MAVVIVELAVVDRQIRRRKRIYVSIVVEYLYVVERYVWRWIYEERIACRAVEHLRIVDERKVGSYELNSAIYAFAYLQVVEGYVVWRHGDERIYVHSWERINVEIIQDDLLLAVRIERNISW